MYFTEVNDSKKIRHSKNLSCRACIRVFYRDWKSFIAGAKSVGVMMYEKDQVAREADIKSLDSNRKAKSN
jgi:hypothetical protein